MQTDEKYEIETHPWEPWLPADAKVLFMGTFPPGTHRWSMDFYYPNPINDFWRICSLLFIGEKEALYDRATRSFNLDAIKAMTIERGIAMSDTVKRARRLKGNAADKFSRSSRATTLPTSWRGFPIARQLRPPAKKPPK